MACSCLHRRWFVLTPKVRVVSGGALAVLWSQFDFNKVKEWMKGR